MIRLFIVALIRFFIIAIALFFALTLLKIIIQALRGHSRPAPHSPQPQNQQQPKEDYRDVKDANFVELPPSAAEDKKDSPL